MSSLTFKTLPPLAKLNSRTRKRIKKIFNMVPNRPPRDVKIPRNNTRKLDLDKLKLVVKPHAFSIIISELFDYWSSRMISRYFSRLQAQFIISPQTNFKISIAHNQSCRTVTRRHRHSRFRSDESKFRQFCEHSANLGVPMHDHWAKILEPVSDLIIGPSLTMFSSLDSRFTELLRVTRHNRRIIGDHFTRFNFPHDPYDRRERKLEYQDQLHRLKSSR